MGAKNTRASHSPLHSEMEVLIWAMECIKNLRHFTVTFATDCAQLVKMVPEPEKWSAFPNYLEDIKVSKSNFHSSELIYIQRTQNTRTDNLACSARKQPSFVFHMDVELPIWFAEST